MVTEIWPGQSSRSFSRIFKFKVTGSRSKVEPGSDHDIAQLDHERNMCAKFELPAYSHRDLARTKWQPPPARPARMKTMGKKWGKKCGFSISKGRSADS